MVGKRLWPVLAGVLLLTGVLLSLGIGRVWLNPLVLADSLFQPKPNLAWLILSELRAPRTVLGVLVGASLGLSGAVLQGLLRNPLAEPGLLGVSAGAALGAVLAIYFGLSATFLLATPMMGIAGAIAAALLTLSIGRGGTLTMILAGVAVSGLMAGGVSLALNFAPNLAAVYEITIWLLGTLENSDWDQVLLVAPFILLGWICLAFSARDIDALTLGEAQAESLGVNLARTRLLALAGTALSVGAATAVTGSIGFIGLLAPHIVRPFVGHQPSRVLLPAALFGAILLVFVDVATRAIPTAGQEIRLGVLTSIVGTPFFFWLVVKLRRLSP